MCSRWKIKSIVPAWLWTLALAVSAGPQNIFAQDYPADHPVQAESVLYYFEQLRGGLDEAAEHCGHKAPFLFSIVAPEMSRYSALTDAAETFALKGLYTNFGGKYADFSIGPFQMKPSFAEYVEREGRKLPGVTDSDYFSPLFPDAESERDSRIMRVERLGQYYTQIRYLALFCILTENKYRDRRYENMKDKVEWFASVYNVGLHLPGEKVERISRQAMFPGLNGRKYRYREAAAAFYTLIDREFR